MGHLVGRHFVGVLVAVLASLTILGAGGAAVAAEGDTVRVSVDSDGVEGNGHSSSAAISDDGRYSGIGSGGHHPGM